MRQVAPLGRHNDANPFNPECRDVSRYHITRAGATEQEVGLFLGGLVRLLQPRVVVETGTGDASATEHLQAAAMANGHGLVVSIDIDPGRVRNARLSLPKEQLTLVEGDATTCVWDVLRGRLVDLAFIDGGVHREQEFTNLLPHLAPRAFVAFHDVANGTAPLGVVLSLVERGLVREPLFFPTPRGLALTQVTR